MKVLNTTSESLWASLHLHRSAITERMYLEIIERYLERIRAEVRELDEVRKLQASQERRVA